MPPRTRSSQTGGSKDHTHAVPDENQAPLQTSTRAGTSNQSTPNQGNATNTALNCNAARPNVSHPSREKRTIGLAIGSNNTASTSTSSQIRLEVSPTKKARTVGPSHGRPMPLKLAHESEIGNEPERPIKGKRVELGRASSYYPGRDDTTHILSYLDTESSGLHKPDVDDHGDEAEEEWEDDEQIVDLALKNPSRFSEVMAVERPTFLGLGDIDESHPTQQNSGQWDNDLDAPGSSSHHAASYAVATPPTPGLGLLTELTVDHALPASSVSPTEAPGATPESPSFSRIDSDLVYASGKFLLTNQRPFIRIIVQDAIENLRAYLLFRNAFPDAITTFSFTRDALNAAAESPSRQPGGAFVQGRLQADDEYLARLVSLPRARVCLFRSEVKERCNAVIVAALFTFGSPAQIAPAIQKELTYYTYTFPVAPGRLGVGGMVKRSQPYRNQRIITVLRDLYFTGGSNSFASRFEHHFPTYQGDDGIVSQEVPIPMVALVATALYAALSEWRTGEQRAVEFSTTIYMDVYQGHVGTLANIRTKRERAFHTMMRDIFSRASATGNAGSSVPIADLDLDTLEE